MRDIMNLGIRLLVIALGAALALAGTYSVTKGPIAEKEIETATLARQEVLDASEFEEVKLDELKQSSEWSSDFDAVRSVYRGLNGSEQAGVTVELASKGYGGDIIMTIGVKADGTINGIIINSHSETASLGSKTADEPYRSQFAGKSAAEPIEATSTGGGNDVTAISGATISSKAVAGGVTTGSKVATIVLGGDGQ